MALIPTFLRGFLRSYLRVRVSSKELEELENRLNEVLAKHMDCDRETFVRDTNFVPSMQDQVNRMLHAEYSADKANRVAELSVLLDKLQTYRTSISEEYKLERKKLDPKNRSLLDFKIIKVQNAKAPNEPNELLAKLIQNVKKEQKEE